MFCIPVFASLIYLLTRCNIFYYFSPKYSLVYDTRYDVALDYNFNLYGIKLLYLLASCTAYAYIVCVCYYSS